MNLPFYKYQGTGNDFILIDNRQPRFFKNDAKLVASFCDRKFGIGADGLILLENDELSDFRMVYFNADGNEGSMCGNGARCIVAFANFLGIIGDKTTFNAVDGTHTASIDGDTVSLRMQNVSELRGTPECPIHGYRFAPSRTTGPGFRRFQGIRGRKKAALRAVRGNGK